jgi:hypothetical protein
MVPFTIRIVFSFYLNDLSSGCGLINCLLDRGGKRFHVDLFPRVLVKLRGRTESDTALSAAASTARVVFTLFVSLLGSGTALQRFILPNITNS